jgi:hypothetical protein
MVIAEKWAEQRVLMRAYAESRDQTRPTIVLHGHELAIGPSGTDIHGPWGIHVVGDVSSEAQTVKHQLEHAARRVAGSKGNPPRLSDESATFDREPTGNWGPGAPRLVPQRPDHHRTAPLVDYVAPTVAARVPQQQQATYVHVSAAQVVAPQRHVVSEVASPSNPELRLTPVVRSKGRTHPPPTRTVLGYTSGSGAQSAIMRLGLAPQVSARLGRLVDRVVPPEFHVDAGERRVLDALGERVLSARAIGQMLDVVDAVAFMEELVRKLESFGLGDLVEPAEPDGDEPTYRLRR